MRRDNLTQERLAREIEVSLITVSRWERDKHKPFPRQLPAIAKALGVDVAWLTQDDEADAASAAMISHAENIAAALLAALGVAVTANKSAPAPQVEPFRIPRLGEPGRPSYDERFDREPVR